MKSFYYPRFTLPALVLPALAAVVCPAPVWAANEGRPDLDKATQLKLGAQSTGELTDVIQLCESAIKKGLDKSDTAFANDLLASALVQRGSATAAKIFGDESSPSARLNLDEHWKTYRSEALADLEKGLKLSPKQPQAFFTLAKLNLLPEGDADKALKALDKAVALSDDDAAMKAKVLLVRSSLRKNLQDRIADLNEALKALPGNAMLLRARGLAQAEGQKWDAALADFDKSIDAEPGSVVAYQLKAAVLIKLSKFNDALAALEKAHSLAPERIDLLVAKSEIYSSQSNYKAAADELTHALAAGGPNLELLTRRADAYQHMGQYDKALADVDKVLEIKPDVLELMRARAGLLADQGQFDKAAEELQKLHKANPKDSQTILQLGALYTTMKQNEKAIAAYDEVLARNPDDVAAMRGRGDALLNIGRRAEAIAEYDKALKLKPGDYGLLNNYAWVLATAPEDKLRDGRRALSMATDACKQTDYKRDYILSTLAAAYAETGDFDSARKYAAQAVEVSSPSKEEPDRKDELKKELESYKASKPWREDLPADDAKKPGNKAEPKAGPQESTGETASRHSAAKQEPSQSDKPKKEKGAKSAPPVEDDDVLLRPQQSDKLR